MRRNAAVHLLFGLVAVLAVAGTIWAVEPVAHRPVKLAEPVEINVSAALGLKDALQEIQTEYEAANANVKLVFNLGPSGVLQKQLEQGVPADLFISASMKQINELQSKNLVVPSTRRILVNDKLVLIVPQNSQLVIESFQDLKTVTRFGMGEPATVPAGQYAMELLKGIEVWEAVKDKAVQAKDVRTIISYVETGNVDAGIAFSTVAALSDKVKVVVVAPDGSHTPVMFPAVAMANAKHPKEAAALLDYLCGPQSAAIFQKYGFSFVGSGQ